MHWLLALILFIATLTPGAAQDRCPQGYEPCGPNICCPL